MSSVYINIFFQDNTGPNWKKFCDFGGPHQNFVIFGASPKFNMATRAYNIITTFTLKLLSIWNLFWGRWSLSGCLQSWYFLSVSEIQDGHHWRTMFKKGHSRENICFLEPLNHLLEKLLLIFLRCEYFILVILIFRLKRPRSCPSNGSRIDKDSNKFRTSPYRLAGYTSYSKIRLDLKTMIVNSKFYFFVLINIMKRN